MVCGCNNKDIVLKFLQLKKAAVSMFDPLETSRAISPMKVKSNFL